MLTKPYCLILEMALLYMNTNESGTCRTLWVKTPTKPEIFHI